MQFAPCPVPQVDDREAKRDTPEEGELRDQRMEITIQNSPYTREGSTEDRYVNGDLQSTAKQVLAAVSHRVCANG